MHRRKEMNRIITLTTDFGHSDPFVGVMKGVILGIAPQARVVDLCHEVPPQNLRTGAFLLGSAFPYFPAGTIHMVVVDPGVGSERAPIAVETEEHLFVGPDNGLIPAAIEGYATVRRAVRLSQAEYHRQPVSHTFHGRDIFAPVAAHLANGVPLEALGEPWERLCALEQPRPVRRGEGVELHVVHVDRFGNLVTDLCARDVSELAGNGPVRFLIGSAVIDGISRTYADVEKGEPMAYFGSSGRLEIAVREGNAAETLGVSVGATICMQSETHR
ncbi:MAG TPA: SAM-dependent chlorinase/fluorinase [Chthonomonadales bacterium]|nr:SAM-dependent chlorinase/fluorinase [Chthonomonadales bacterium]